MKQEHGRYLKNMEGFQMKPMHKKGNLSSLYGYIMTFVLVAILLGVGLIVLDEFTGQTATGSEAEAAVNYTISALGDFADRTQVST